jgi:hypothetical protein
MDAAVKRLANALRLAEQAHADFEKKHPAGPHEWPEFYAQWLLDNIHLWSKHSCEGDACDWHEWE